MKTFLTLFVLFFSSSVFAGECTSGDCTNGFGTYTYTGVFPAEYEGEWKDDAMHGQGTYTFPDGRKYVGELKDDKKHGQGIFTFPDGRKRVGEWKDGKMNGQGTYTYADGSIDNGIWKNNEFVEANNENSIKISEKKVVQSQSNSSSELYCLNKGLRQRSLEMNFGKCPAGFKEISKQEFYSFPNLPIINEKSDKVIKQLNTITKSNTTTEQVVVTSTKLDKKSLKEELQYWKELFQDELITQAEYDAKRKELLSGASVTTTTKVVEPVTQSNQSQHQINLEKAKLEEMKKQTALAQKNLEEQKRIAAQTKAQADQLDYQYRMQQLQKGIEGLKNLSKPKRLSDSALFPSNKLKCKTDRIRSNSFTFTCD